MNSSTKIRTYGAKINQYKPHEHHWYNSTVQKHHNCEPQSVSNICNIIYCIELAVR